MTVSEVTADAVDHVFDVLAPMVERGLKHGVGDRTTLEHFRAAVKAGAMSLWVVHDGPEIVAGVVLSVVHHPTKKALFVQLAAGRDMDSWVGEIERLLRDAKDLIGADMIEATCRLGMASKLAKRGWRKKAIVMELSDG